MFDNRFQEQCRILPPLLIRKQILTALEDKVLLINLSEIRHGFEFLIDHTSPRFHEITDQ